MGDRTTVELTVLLEHADVVENICEANHCSFSDVTETEEIANFLFHDVNYGNLDILQNLVDAGIPYESYWESGSEYGPGTAYCRFTPDGEALLTEIYESERGLSLERLLPHIDDHKSLKKIILLKQEQLAVLPLDKKQIQYGKVYLTKKLITPSEITPI